MKKSKLMMLVFAAVSAYNSYVLACGPDFDQAYLTRRTQEELLAIPEGHFVFELQRLTAKQNTYEYARDAMPRVIKNDIEELQKSMKLLAFNAKDFNEALASYKKAREDLSAFLSKYPEYEGYFRNSERLDNKDKPALPIPSIILSPVLPAEFSFYLKGAAHYHGNDFKGAIVEWEKILQLPPKSRQFKSVWAAFMLGKAHLSIRDQAKANFYFEMTRKLAKDGFADSLNLSAETIGWQAKAEYESKQYVESIHHYLQLMDVNSLKVVCSAVANTNDGTIESVMKDKEARNILLAWAVSGHASDNAILDRLLAAVEGVKENAAVEYADRIAWLYYDRGNIDKAQRWLKQSKLFSPLAQYVDFKITLRNGDTDAAMDKLTSLLPTFVQSQEVNVFYNENVDSILHSELAVLKLNRKEYLQSFELLLKGKYWEDVAYVAEKVLTPEELESYLKSADKHPELLNKLVGNQKTSLESLNHLLARRYARQENWSKAIEFMPKDLTQNIIELKNLTEKAQNKKLSNADRSKAYFDAAMLMHQKGMELAGTELDPDAFVYEGYYEYPAVDNRFIHSRVSIALPKPNKRFHYRYTAANLMWKAAELLPNNNELKAQALYKGGIFIEKRDPAAANKFYKELVRTCSNTDLGKRAEQKKWFPQI